MIRRMVVVALAAVALVAVDALPAQAALSITAPDSVDLGSTVLGTAASVGGQLGPVEVSSDATTAGWTVTVTATAFTTGAGSPAQTIATSKISYWSGPATATTATTATPGQPTAADAEPLSSPVVAFTGTPDGGPGTVDWNPTIAVDLSGATLAGAYSAVITQSVA